jgi:hypothetical protein
MTASLLRPRKQSTLLRRRRSTFEGILGKSSTGLEEWAGIEDPLPMKALRGALLLLLLAAPAAAQWQTIEPGGDTVCADGSPYRFFVHPGDPARLLVEFEGGGACWDAETCAMPIYSRNVVIDPELARRYGLLVGIYDRGNRANPFREWTHLYVPYCTGDLHWGKKGGANAAAALRWVSENVAAPAQVTVTGCSAGGYGAILWAPALADRYPGASLVELADSAAGVVPAGFFSTVLTAWDVSAAWPKDIPSLALDTLDPARLTLADFYAGVAAHYPLATFAQFNTLGDSTQTFFYGLTRGAPATAGEWSPQMQAQIAAIEAASPNFAAYTAPGSQHCIINTPGFYTTTVSGVRLVDWVNGLLASPRAPASVP